MKTQAIDVKTSDGICDAYVAYPDSGSYPAVLFYMDAFGPRPYLYEMAERLAAQRYFVFMPNVFYRAKRAPVVDLKFPLKAEDMPEAIKVIMPLFQTFSMQAALSDVKSFLDYLAGLRQVRPGKIGAIGYCMGGGLAICTAAQYPDRVAAVASYHAGNLVTDAPDSVHHLIKKLKAELYIAHADNDKSMPTEQIERLRAILAQASIKSTAELYSGALHGFTMADLPAFNGDALERHWKSLLDLFSRNLRD